MNFKDILSAVLPVIEKSAPAVASAIGSPIAGIGMNFAMSLLSNVFDVKPTDVHTLPDIMSNDPDVHDKLSQVEEQFKHYFVNSPQMPSVAEINVKLVWDKQVN